MHTRAHRPIDHLFLRRLRIASIIEGISTLVLFFIAMPLKYLAGMPMAVTIVGSLHGILFMGVVALFILAIGRVPISVRLAAAGIIGAIFPFGPFIVDRWLHRVQVGSPDPSMGPG
ncbi:MAG TPA: DUF3817 domain-containing protein [Phycisphaerales bacterium]|nr:DUF3817 domain-containing protein [Phycisphaerales bacterium]HMP36612.1 DUF3817 domain-containing protein [Phycisphaerales bacterium]